MNVVVLTNNRVSQSFDYEALSQNHVVYDEEGFEFEAIDDGFSLRGSCKKK